MNSDARAIAAMLVPIPIITAANLLNNHHAWKMTNTAGKKSRIMYGQSENRPEVPQHPIPVNITTSTYQNRVRG